MEKEYVLKLHTHEVALIVHALEGEMECAKRVIALNEDEQYTLDFVKQCIGDILDRIKNKMICIN